MQAKKHMKKIGLEREDYYFLKQVGKALLCTYTILGALWLYNETSPLGWWKLKPKEELEFLYPSDKEAKEFIAKGGMIETTSGPKGLVESDKDADDYQKKELQSKKFDQEAQKLWLKMRNEAIAELKKKGFDVE
ncbi:hypothetical protein SESBI_45434 [Sesbania bispinosa]|nr:hypothetical protein SESBI_45434 [Sesbania bispinosa]